jgi:hypothetical protein
MVKPLYTGKRRTFRTSLDVHDCVQRLRDAAGHRNEMETRYTFQDTHDVAWEAGGEDAR